MSIRELDKLNVLHKLTNKVINQEQAAEILGLTVRQVQRLAKSYRENGAKGLISKKRGKPSNRHLPASDKEWIS